MSDSKTYEELSNAQSQMHACNQQADVLVQEISSLENKLDHQDGATREFDQLINEVNEFRIEKLSLINKVKLNTGSIRAIESYARYMEEHLSGKAAYELMESLDAVRQQMNQEIHRNYEYLDELKAKQARTQETVYELEAEIRRLQNEDNY
jgi:uncharacterized coiled-coil DUF342 family protein